MNFVQDKQQYFINTYNKIPLVLASGEGVYLYDTMGKAYLDFAAGIAVSSLGYGHSGYVTRLSNQMQALMHCSNLFYSQVVMEAGKKLSIASGLGTVDKPAKVFFTNSGTEANEGAIKLAKKYFYNKGQSKHHFIAMKNSFHGRSTGALAITGQAKYQEAFKPLLPETSFANLNDLSAVKSLIREDTCAIFLEPIQGEGGIHTASKDFLFGLRALCDELDILLIFDEIQCGCARSGEMFAYMLQDVKPDILTVAKGIGGGFPVGAFIAGDKVLSTFHYGDHGTTYGGNPMAAAAVSAVLDAIENEGLIAHVKEVGDYLSQALRKLTAASPKIIEHRGQGLIQGIVLDRPVAPIINKVLEAGVILINAGDNVIRFVPPLIIEKAHVDKMVSVLEEVISEL